MLHGVKHFCQFFGWLVYVIREDKELDDSKNRSKNQDLSLLDLEGE